MFDDGDDRVGVDEARQVVDVAVGVVAGDAVAEPERVGDAEIIAEDGFHVVARSKPGLRACTGLSRHSSVVSRVPRPLTSMLPPSSTNAAGSDDEVGSQTLGSFNFGMSRLVAASSFGQSSYLAQALKRQLVMATPPGSCASLFLDEDGAVVARPAAIGGHRKKLDGGQVGAGLGEDALGAGAFFGAAWTRMRTRSTRARWRTISA